ncbi:hypothetical protein ACQ4PT_068288 [Festuca glaucescens]
MAASLGRLRSAIYDKEERKTCVRILPTLFQFYGHGKNVDNSLPIKTDKDTLREGYRFILSDEDDVDSTWGKRLVKRYYDKLFKEYCIADMSQYKKGKIGLRWRTEKEVISGKGQFICGNRKCDENVGLGSYEVNFSYVEAGEQKQALVKLVACKRCAEKLAHKRQKEKEKEMKLSAEEDLKERDKRKREHDDESEDTTEDESSKKRSRKKKDLKGTSNRKVGNKDDDFEEFLEGMFP